MKSSGKSAAKRLYCAYVYTQRIRFRKDGKQMKIALINENSQAAKNAMICETLKKVVEPMGHEVFNYGMYTAEDAHQLTYVQNGILAAVLLNSGAADFVDRKSVV